MKIGWLNKMFGNRGERLAAKYLKRKGYRILARQARNRFGEIDIIALDGDSIVFVEVKTRSSDVAGHPAEAVTHQKQRQITKTALVWLKSKGLTDRRCRFDVIAISFKSGNAPHIEHIAHAFEATDY